MRVVDQVRMLKHQGMDDSQVAIALQDQGIPPREINEAMAQVNIKDAVSNPEQALESQELDQRNMQPGMQPSLLNLQGSQSQNQMSRQGNSRTQEWDQQIPSPSSNIPQPGQQPQEYYSEDSQGYSQDQSYPQEYSQDAYPSYPQNQGQQNYDYASQDTMSEVASQIVTEKTKSLSKKINDLGEMNSLLTSKVEKMDERLSRIESIIDRLQTSILRKANAQEQNIEDIKSEMGAMQDSFGKVINPLVSLARKSPARKSPTKKKTKHKAKKR